jgi:hypothetical protein
MVTHLGNGAAPKLVSLLAAAVAVPIRDGFVESDIANLRYTKFGLPNSQRCQSSSKTQSFSSFRK